MQSLFQYEKTIKNKNSVSRFSSMTTGLISSQHFGAVITGFNSQYSAMANNLHLQKLDLAESLSKKLAENPNYTGMRSEGVKLAWEYEKADIQMGGKGSGNWDEAQRQEILETGRVRGAEGHHGKNVAQHPQDQADPDNIKFYKDHEQHRIEGHDGDFRNPTDMPKTDKEAMLRRTNTRRVVKKELQGVALAAAIGFGIGASIEVVSTLAREGISIRSVKTAFVNGLKAGLKSAWAAVKYYTITRAINYTLQRVFGVSAAWADKVAAPIAACIFAVVEFITLKKAGYSNEYALKQAGKSALVSMAIYALGYIPYVGLYLQITAGVAYTIYGFASGLKEEKFYRDLERREAEWALPVLA